MKPILDIEDVGKEDLERVGGKGASLGRLVGADLNVPPGFIVTAGAFRKFIDENGIADEIFALLREVDSEDSQSLKEASESIEDLIMGADFPAYLREEIRGFYADLDDEPYVAVRSSATAEDLPDASFAGQQKTFLNVRGYEDLEEGIRRCWASLYTPRAIFYRENQGFEHEQVDIAVVVQVMVDAEKAGVMFTSHPTTGKPEVLIEAAWGLGESVVGGGVSPDSYSVDRATGRVIDVNIGNKGIMFVREDGSTVEKEVPRERAEARVLDEEELRGLTDLADELEGHYGSPQDVEWAIVGDEVFLLQSRPITTIRGEVEAEEVTGEVLLTGLPASPGRAAGRVKLIWSVNELDRVESGDVLVTEMTTPDMVPGMKRAAAIVTDEGGLTCHAAIVSRELGTPCIVGTSKATATLSDGQVVTIDGDRGKVYRGNLEEGNGESAEARGPRAAPAEVTATEVKVNVSIPEAAERAAATGADGVGLLRLEHMVLDLEMHPSAYIEEGRGDEYVDALFEGVSRVAEAFYPRPVWVRTLDAPTDEFRSMEGGESEPVEQNPMMGLRGIRRDLEETEHFALEAVCFRRLVDRGLDNVGIMLPLVSEAGQVGRARELLEAEGLDLDALDFGVMVETPASALVVEDIASEGVDFVSFGTNDLTQYTLAVDRNDENVRDLYRADHPAVLKLIERVIDTCSDLGVKTSICGQAGSDPRFVETLVNYGIDSVSANIDAVSRIRRTVARAERRIMLESARRRS
ncbi:MAG: Phosphoenolpyruvate synthase [Methanonatronarchaeales archaeon]|nr:Phosphoenolpyruvate synthase [Methanonatronarchaeales archaeon]